MYNFKNLEACYDLDIEFEYPDLHVKQFHCREQVRARYEKEYDRYRFVLDGKENIMLNNKVPEEIMDQLMIEIGMALYPIELLTNPYGKMLRIDNFDLIRRRWKNKSDALIKEQNSPPFTKYIEISSRHVKDENTFWEAIGKNTFIKLFFIPFGVDNFVFTFADFPERGNLMIFNCKKEAKCIENGYQFSYTPKLLFPLDYLCDAKLQAYYSEAGDLLLLQAIFDMEDSEGNRSSKKITIRSDKKRRNIGKKSKSWKTFFD